MSNDETLYARYLSGELSEAEEVQLRKSGDWEKLANIAKLTGEFSLPPMDRKKQFEALSDHTGFNQSVNSSRRLYLNVIRGVAASILLLAGYFLFFGNQSNTLKAPLANRVEHVFEDQSVVSLNAGSDLTFNESSWEKERHVKLRGEAFFNVTTGAKFSVETTLGTTEVLGTSFNVRARDNRLNVQCYEGSVRVQHGAQIVVLKELQAVLFDEHQKITEYNLTNDTPEWKDGRSIFQNEPIRHVLDELARQYDIEVNDQNLAMPFSGAFDHHDLDLAIEQIARPLGLKYTRSENGNRINFSK